MAHEVVLKVVIHHDGVHVDHIWVLVDTKDKLFRMKETDVYDKWLR
jgi:hypothetical protein